MAETVGRTGAHGGAALGSLGYSRAHHRACRRTIALLACIIVGLPPMASSARSGVNSTLFPHYDTMQKVEDAASDHGTLSCLLAPKEVCDIKIQRGGELPPVT